MAAPAPLPPARRAFILRWGEVARGLGLTKSGGQVWALILSAESPLSAAEIAEALSIARSNVSAALKELRGFGLVRSAPAPGERQERFAAPDAPEEAAAALLSAFRARVSEPAAAALSALEGAPRLAAYAGYMAALGPALEAALAPAAAQADPPKKKKKKK